MAHSVHSHILANSGEKPAVYSVKRLSHTWLEQIGADPNADIKFLLLGLKLGLLTAAAKQNNW